MSVRIEEAREKAEALMTLRKAPLQNRIFVALFEKGTPQLVRTISRETKLPESSVRFALRALRDKGLVVKSPFFKAHYQSAITTGEMSFILLLVVMKIQKGEVKKK